MEHNNAALEAKIGQAEEENRTLQVSLAFERSSCVLSPQSSWTLSAAQQSCRYTLRIGIRAQVAPSMGQETCGLRLAVGRAHEVCEITSLTNLMWGGHRWCWRRRSSSGRTH